MECVGADYEVEENGNEYVSSLTVCSTLCQEAYPGLLYFVFGHDSNRCSGSACKCYCQDLYGGTCVFTTHSHYHLYKIVSNYYITFGFQIFFTCRKSLQNTDSL